MITNVITYLEQHEAGRIVDERGTCSFRQLADLGKKIGTALCSRIEIGTPVPVYMEKSIDALAAFVGAVYAGGFYSFLNPELPIQRLEQILGVLKPRVIIIDKDHEEIAGQLLAQLDCADNEKPELLYIENLYQSEVCEEKLQLRAMRHTDMDPLYANFTSGSTGIPKGVLVGHRSVIDFIDCFTEEFEITKEDVICSQAPFDFDVSVKDIYSAFRTGATLVLIPRRLFSNPAGLLDFLCEHKVTTMIWAVSALCLISTFHGLDYRTPDSLKKVLFSGEVMPARHLKDWMEHLPNTEFVNLYGPTEITCNCTYHRIDPNRVYEKGIPIGTPFANEKVFLLDANDHLITEPGITGELCVAGTALALGYYHAPEQTQKAFCSNPLVKGWTERMYRTGDLALYNEEGELFFAGRKDFQIKYMGHRIELEEIDRAVNKVPEVVRCCTIYDAAAERLYGFYVGNIDKKELHAKLSAELPPFMIPGRLVQVGEMPMTANGKIDRKRLLAENGGRRRRGER